MAYGALRICGAICGTEMVCGACARQRTCTSAMSCTASRKTLLGVIVTGVDGVDFGGIMVCTSIIHDANHYRSRHDTSTNR
eukprot:1346570-Rhodomonas_salina.3